MAKLFLLDAYALIYRSYYAFIRAPRINSKGLNVSAIMGFCNTLHEVLTKEHPDYLGVAFDHGRTFRHEAFPAYKAQREETPEDIRAAVPVIKDILAAMHIPVLQEDGFEADDVIGTLATRAGEQGIETYMLTPDKDYGQLIRNNVYMYRPRHGGGYDIIGPDQVTEKYGIATPSQVIDLLALMGDSADNFPGCPGVGEKTAVKLINEFGSIDNLLANTAQLKGKMREKVEGAVEDIRMSRFLATIKTDVPTVLDLDALKVTAPDSEQLTRLFDDLEFRTLASKFLGKREEKGKRKEERDLFAAEGDLFASSEERGEGREERELYRKDELFLTIETTPLQHLEIPADLDAARQLLTPLKGVLEDAAVGKVGHDLKRTIKVLHSLGITLRGPLFDTMLAHYVVQPELRHDLDYLASLIEEGGKMKEEGEYPREAIAWRLKEMLEPKLQEVGGEKLFREIEMPLVGVLADMELQGVRLDTAALGETSRLFTERLKDYETKIYREAGEQFNISSPKQVGDILFGKMQIMEKPRKTKTGQYVTSEEVLQSLRAKAPIVADILDYRGLKKLLGTYVDALPRLVNATTGHIHTSFNQAVTATGRLSSSEPNLQNIPVRDDDGKEIRKCFIPEPGELFFSADYSQIELRIMAHLSQDEHMLDAFRSGQDIHAATAAKIWKKPVSEVTAAERKKAKQANFGIIYGITTYGLAQRMEISNGEARTLIDDYFRTFPRVRAFMDEAKESARQRGYAETLFGRRRYLPDILSRNGTVRGFAERNAINAPIQGSEADIIKVAMIAIHRRFQTEGLRAKMLLQVHDELNFSVPPEERDRVEQIVREEMQRAYPLSVPLQVDCGWGSNWLEAH